jgi:hypothetical protein
MNCGKDVPPQEAMFFMKTLVCADCNLIATRLYAQGNNELEQLKLSISDLIQHTIVLKRLALPTASAPGQVSAMNVVSALIAMMGRKYEKENPVCLTSSAYSAEKESTKPCALTPVVDGPQSCISTWGAISRSGTVCTGTLSKKEWASVRDASVTH